MVDTTNFRLDSNQLGHIERRLQNIAEAIDRNTVAVNRLETAIRDEGVSPTVNVFTVDPNGSS